VSDIPPIAASGAQAGFQQAEVSRTRDARRADQIRARAKSATAIDEAGNTIETDDNDACVFSDAEGAGGQGRSEEEGEHSPEADESQDGHESTLAGDDDGDVHLDLQA